MTLAVKAGLRFEGATSGFLTDHMRGTIDISFDEVSSFKRTVTGTSRGFVVARKHIIQVSWEKVPSDYSMTVDGYWGGKEITDFYNANLGSFTVRVYNRDKVRFSYADSNPELSLTMRFTDFSSAIVSRNIPITSTTVGDLWNLSFTLEEI